MADPEEGPENTGSGIDLESIGFRICPDIQGSGTGFWDTAKYYRRWTQRFRLQSQG
jgi:hypothetical protein